MFYRLFVASKVVAVGLLRIVTRLVTKSYIRRGRGWEGGGGLFLSIRIVLGFREEVDMIGGGGMVGSNHGEHTLYKYFDA